jgi:hypothetical protein
VDELTVVQHSTRLVTRGLTREGLGWVGPGCFYCRYYYCDGVGEVNSTLVAWYFGSQPDRATSSTLLYAQSYNPPKAANGQRMICTVQLQRPTLSSLALVKEP